MAEKPVTERRIKLFGFQQGPSGFVRVGTSPNPLLSEWEDYLYLIAKGGRGAGKSRAGAFRLLHYVNTWPRCLGTVTAPTLNMMHDSTLPAIKGVFEAAGLMEGREYEYVTNREELLFYNGAKALLRSTEHPDRLRGPDSAFFWMDEPGTSPFVAFTNLQGQLRQNGFPHQGWATGTPVGKRHWTYKVFEPGAMDEEDEEDELERGIGRYLTFRAATRANPHGGRQLYLSMIRTLGKDSLQARQELGGEDVLMDGLTYETWDPDYHVVEPEKWPVRKPSQVCAGVDFGFANPSAIIVEGVDNETRRYLLEEFYKAGMDEEAMVEEAWRLKRKWGIRYFFCDSADPRWIRAMKNAGLPVMRANKKVGGTGDISSGLGLCTRALNRRIPVYHYDELGKKVVDAEGQAFFVNPSLKNFVREIEGYIRIDSTEKKDAPEHPQSKDDHDMDAWRYAEQGIIRLGWDRVESQRAKVGSIKTTINVVSRGDFRVSRPEGALPPRVSVVGARRAKLVAKLRGGARIGG